MEVDVEKDLNELVVAAIECEWEETESDSESDDIELNDRSFGRRPLIGTLSQQSPPGKPTEIFNGPTDALCV